METTAEKRCHQIFLNMENRWRTCNRLTELCLQGDAVVSKTIRPGKFRKASDLEAPVVAKGEESSDTLPTPRNTG